MIFSNNTTVNSTNLPLLLLFISQGSKRSCFAHTDLPGQLHGSLPTGLHSLRLPSGIFTVKEPAGWLALLGEGISFLMGCSKNYIMYWGGYVYYNTIRFARFQEPVSTNLPKITYIFCVFCSNIRTSVQILPGPPSLFPKEPPYIGEEHTHTPGSSLWLSHSTDQ